MRAMPKHPPFIDAVLLHVHQHLDDALLLDELAAVAGVSPFHLQREFKRAVGHSPAQQLQAGASPNWPLWRALFSFPFSPEVPQMQVRIVNFPDTPVAAIEHHGSSANVYASTAS